GRPPALRTRCPGSARRAPGPRRTAHGPARSVPRSRKLNARTRPCAARGGRWPACPPRSGNAGATPAPGSAPAPSASRISGCRRSRPVPGTGPAAAACAESTGAGRLPFLRLLDRVTVGSEHGRQAVDGLGLELLHLLLLHVGEVGQVAEGRRDLLRAQAH